MKTRIKRESSDTGMALIMVMLVVLTLTAIVAGFAKAMTTEMRLARNTDYNVQLEWMGRSGMELARWAIGVRAPGEQGFEAKNQFWYTGIPNESNAAPFSLHDIPAGAGSFTVKITDMESKWDINLLAGYRGSPPRKDILQSALTVIGVTDTEQSTTIIDSLCDWVNPNPDSSFSGAKEEYYMHQNPPYHCKNGPINDLNELLLIKGITPEIYSRTTHGHSAYEQNSSGTYDQPHAGRYGFSKNTEPTFAHGMDELFSPWGARLNVNTADPVVIQTISPGMDEGLISQAIQGREVEPFRQVGEFAGALSRGLPNPQIQSQINQLCDVHSTVFDVEVDAQINGATQVFHGIVSRQGQGLNFICMRFYWDK